MTGTEKHSSTEQRNTVTKGVAATQDSTFERREVGAQAIITLELEGLIRRQPGIARSIQLLIDPSTLPPLLPSQHQSVKTAVHWY